MFAKNIKSKFTEMNTLAFRSDTRTPESPDYIFEHGMQRRGATYDEYVKNNRQCLEPTLVPKSNYSVLPASAVCATLQPDIAPLFPLSKDNYIEDTWIYFVPVKMAYPTHVTQRDKKSSLAFAEEILLRDIPSGEILGAIKCKRYFNVDPNDGKYYWDNGMHYKLEGDIIWNKKLLNAETERMKNYKTIIEEIVDERKGKYIQCPIPKTKEERELAKEGKFHPPLKILTKEEHAEIENQNQLLRLKFQTANPVEIDAIENFNSVAIDSKSVDNEFYSAFQLDLSLLADTLPPDSFKNELQIIFERYQPFVNVAAKGLDILNKINTELTISDMKNIIYTLRSLHNADQHLDNKMYAEMCIELETIPITINSKEYENKINTIYDRYIQKKDTNQNNNNDIQKKDTNQNNNKVNEEYLQKFLDSVLTANSMFNNNMAMQIMKLDTRMDPKAYQEQVAKIMRK